MMRAERDETPCSVCKYSTGLDVEVYKCQKCTYQIKGHYECIGEKCPKCNGDMKTEREEKGNLLY